MQIVSRSAAYRQWLELLIQERAIAVLRISNYQKGLKMADAVAHSGMRLMEVTWNSDRPAQLIRELRDRYPHCTIGVGTVLSQDDLSQAIDAGAQFGFSPHTDPALIQWAAQQKFPLCAGALSPSEIVAAWNAGAASVKVFPAQTMGGAQYIKNLQGPLSQIPLIPTGGINCELAPNYIHAGAIAIGLAGCLFAQQYLQQDDWLGLTQHIQQFHRNLLTQTDSIPNRFIDEGMSAHQPIA